MNLELTQENLQIVVIESPYFTMRDNEFVREMFGKIMGVRLNAYLQDYSEGVFPFGKEDFFSDIVSICYSDKDKLTPLYSFKITHLRDCIQFGCEFPLIAMLKNKYEQTESLKQLINYVEFAKDCNLNLAYYGSRSKTAEYNWDKASAKLIQNMGITALVGATLSLGIDKFCLFAMFNKEAYKYCEMLGMEKIIDGPMIVESLGHSNSYIMQSREFSLHATMVFDTFSHLWEQRIHVRRDLVSYRKTA